MHDSYLLGHTIFKIPRAWQAVWYCWVGLLSGLGLVVSNAQAVQSTDALTRVAFFYGQRPPILALSQYDTVVVEPTHLNGKQLSQLQQHQTQVFAYLSLGEVNNHLWADYGLPSILALGTNKGWHSQIIDLSRSEWRHYVLNTLIPPLQQAGYNGLFLDTLDSYQQVARTPGALTTQRNALVGLIQAIHRQYPALKLFLNRGFELLPDVQPQAWAVAAESLFYTFAPDTRRYRPTTSDEQQWLLKQLHTVRQFGIPVTVIDYLPAAEWHQARQVARKIAKLGFSPWVSNPDLDKLGIGLLEPVPRRLLIVHDNDGLFKDSDVHIVATVAEYLGLVPVYANVNQPLPAVPLSGQYAGIVSWLTATPRNSNRFQQWLSKQLADRVPILFFQQFPVTDAQLLKTLGLRRSTARLQKPLTVVQQRAEVGTFEAPLTVRRRGLQPLVSQGRDQQPWLTLQTPDGEQITPILTTAWGGVALAPYVLTDNGAGYRQWLVDPFALITQALQLPAMPVPDTTTENGRRILTSHIDGDGFASRAELPGTPFSGEVLLQEVFKPYAVPHTVSVVEGEVGPQGLYPELSPTLEPIARTIFKLPHVELASHSYSHPFFWQPQRSNIRREDTLYGYHLPITGYVFNTERDIAGSIAYINRRLAPDNKKVKVFLWTGDASPNQQAVALTRAQGVANMNGGNSRVTRTYPSITGLYPQGVPLGDELQVYAPLMNENVYTNDWTGPYYGYRRVIETFELTEQPRRLKPISIYWHFYSGTKAAALNALKDVYDWALSQQPLPLFISEYAPRIAGFYNTHLAKTLDDQWQVTGLGALRTLRVAPTLGWPDPVDSDNVAGFKDLPQGRYLHLSGPQARLCFKASKPNAVYLADANGSLQYWRYQQTATGESVDPQSVAFRMHGHQPVTLTVVSPYACTLRLPHRSLLPVRTGQQQRFTMDSQDTGDALLVCQ